METVSVLKTITIMKENRKYCFAILLILEILLMVYMTWQWGAQWLDSDDSGDTMILAELLSREGSILSKNWYYTSELRIPYTQIVMAILFHFFSDWHVVRTIGTGIMLVILLSSYLYFCRSVNLGKGLLYLSPLILWPFSREYVHFVLYGLFYLPYLAIVFLSLGLCLNNAEKQRTLRLFMLAMISFIAGLGGFRMVAVCYLPLVMATLITLFPVFRSDNGIAKSYFMKSLVAAGASLTGLFVNSTILAKSYSFVTLQNRSFTLPDRVKVFSIIKSIPAFFGAVKSDFSSLSVIVVLLVLILCLVIGYMGLRLFKSWKSLEQETQILLAFFLFSFLVTVFGPIFSTQGWARRYMIFPGIGFLVIIAAYMEQFKPNGAVKKVLCGFILIAELAAGFNQCYKFINSKAYPYIDVAYSYILDSGMKFGFGDWDSSDVLTELSNGRIHFCKVGNFKHMDAWYWQMEKDFQKYAKGGPVFLILDNKRFSYNGGVSHVWGSWTSSDLAYLNTGKMVFQDQYYTIWRYESFEQFEALVGKKF